MRQEWKRLVLAGVVVIALLGVIVAINNLPVRTGCGYYGICPETGPDAVPSTAAPSVEQAS